MYVSNRNWLGRVPMTLNGPAALRRKSNKLLLFFADSLTNSLSSVLIHSVISACFSAASVSLPSLESVVKFKSRTLLVKS